MNYFLKVNSNYKIICTIARLIHTSKSVCRRPPDWRSAFRKIRKFPCFKVHYDTDAEGPLNVIIDENRIYPPGYYGSMPIKEAWKRHKEGQVIRDLPTYFDKLESMTWTEYNMWYHTVQLPLKFPETLNFAQFITRTSVIDDVPDSVKDSFSNISSDDIGKTSQFLKRHLENYLIQSAPFTPKYDDEERCRQSNEFICQMMDSIARSRVSDKYFANYTTAPNSIIETFFKRSGYERLEAPEIVKDAEGCVKYRLRGSLAWQLRSRDVLKEFISVNDPTLVNHGTLFPAYDYHPKIFGLEPADCEGFRHLPFTYSIHTSKYPRNVPGYWGKSPFKVGDPCAFSVLGVINTDLSRDLHRQYLPKHQNVIDRHNLSEAVLSGFTWTLAQAQNQGFSIYDELTYPFCTCILLTDGRQTQMTYYQLNSISSLWKPESANFPANLLWVGPKMNLFELDSSGQIADINEHVIHQILAAFSMPHSYMSTAELQPYLKDTSSRDLTQLMIDFNPATATTKELEQYKINSRNLQVFKYSKSHPNRMFYVDVINRYQRGEMLREMVPGVEAMPADVMASIKRRLLLREKLKRGKNKLLREPMKWM